MRNEQEFLKLKKFRGVCRKDNYEYTDLFMPVIDRVIESDNPQLHFNVVADDLVLNKNMKPDEEKPDSHHIEVDCSECSGSGENRWGGSCRGCNGIGKVGVEK
jgi:hypothetical protein